MIVYCLLAIIAIKRLRGGMKKLNHAILIVILVLVWVRIWIRHAFGGHIYQLTVIFVGIAAGIAALTVAKMLISQTPSDEAEAGHSGDRIQSLKLS